MHNDATPRNRWFSKSTNNASASSERLPFLSENPKSKFYAFASVIGIGIKPKKQPVNTSDTTPPHTGRPHAKSFSSTLRSRDESLEISTPLDLTPPKRLSTSHSVFSVLNPDPFAADAVAISRPIASTRLYTDSNNPSYEVLAKKREPRLAIDIRPTSQASASSQSIYSDAVDYLGPLRSPLASPHAARSPTKSPTTGSSPDVSTSEAQVIPGSATITKPGSSLTLNDKNRGPGNESSYMPHTLPRTVRSRSAQPGTADARKDTAPPSIPSPTGPLVPSALARTRTLSARVARPPSSAPPAQVLPPRPLITTTTADEVVAVDASTVSFSASKTADHGYYRDSSRYQGVNGRQLAWDREIATRRSPHERVPVAVHSNSNSNPTWNDRAGRQTLKKATSYQSLTVPKTRESTHMSTLVADEKGNASAMRKQRSFHQPRLTIPPPPPYSNPKSNYSPSTQPHTPNSVSESLTQRRSSTYGLPVHFRRCLFSGSSVRKLENGMGVDEDLRSIYSLPVEVTAERVRAYSPAPTTFSRSPRDRARAHSPASIATTGTGASASTTNTTTTTTPIDYIPQHIMSPAEMLKVEAIVQSEFDNKYGDTISRARGRERGMSILSVQTMPALGRAREGERGLGFNTNAAGGVTRSTSRSASVSRARLAVGVRAAQESKRSPTFGQPGAFSSISATSTQRHPFASPHATYDQPHLNMNTNTNDAPYAGLPPPPRPRLRSSTSTPATRSSSSHNGNNDYNYNNYNFNNNNKNNKRSSGVSITPLAPPPVNGRKAQVTRRTSTIGRSAEGGASHAGGWMIRKPSFLEISDNYTDTHGAKAKANSSSTARLGRSESPPRESSFIDFGRESIDSESWREIGEGAWAEEYLI